MPQSFDPIYAGNWEALNEFLSGIVSQEDLGEILAAVAEVDWRPLNYGSGFSDVGGEYAPARVRLTLNNVVHVEGLVQHTAPLSPGDVGVVIATLESDCLPGERLVYAGACNDTQIARVDVHPDGTISFEGFLITIGAPPVVTPSANAITTLEGGATFVSPGGTPDPSSEVELTSYSDSYGACQWLVPAVITPASLGRLQLDYQLSMGGAGGGSPRLSIGVDGSALHCLLGTPPNFSDAVGAYITSPNFADPESLDQRFDLSQYGGPQTGTWADVLDLLGDHRITSVFGVCDAGWKFTGPSGQVVRFRNAHIDSVTQAANWLSLSGINFSVGAAQPT